MGRFLKMALSDKTHIKLTIGIFLSMVASLICGTWVVSKKFAEINYSISTNHNDIVLNIDDIEDLADEDKERDLEIRGIQIQQAQINTKLVNIESGILEIKSILKDR